VAKRTSNKPPNPKSRKSHPKRVATKPPIERASVKQAAFLAAYRQLGVVSRAAKITGINRSRHFEWLQEDTDNYRQRFAEAHNEAIEVMEAEAHRRAVEGWTKPVFGSGGQGVGTVQVGTVREYSDTLLIFLLKGANPEKYRDNSRVQLDGNVNHTGNVQIFLPDNSRE
jgi:hypothetical protein